MEKKDEIDDDEKLALQIELVFCANNYALARTNRVPKGFNNNIIYSNPVMSLISNKTTYHSFSIVAERN